MSQLQAILNYQKIDEELYALERELSSSKERKEYVQAKKFLMSAAEKLDLLDVKAKQLEGEVAALAKKAAEAEETLKDFSNVDELMENGADVAFYKKNALALLEQFKKLKASLNALIATINATDEEYKKLKKQVLTMQKQYKEAQEKYAAVKDSREEERQAIEARLKEAKKDVSPETMERYLNKRKEKIFPVVGQLHDKRCPYCGMEPPLAAVNKLTAGSTIECDSCHRILYGE
ncbi:MAG: hypothetical protein IJY62_00605 [Clostridia bacterium]|nr:hypothetical protein [Clostridia bacterium]